jgi:hypothetical protein
MGNVSGLDQVPAPWVFYKNFYSATTPIASALKLLYLEPPRSPGGHLSRIWVQVAV